MTDNEFDKQQTSMLADVPEAFRGWMSDKAWETSHSGGYAEVLSELYCLIDGFGKALAEYNTEKKGEE